ncbi:unnamed protein product, partial [Pocillopora meandrina]
AVNKETSQGSTSFIVVLWPLFKYADDSTIISSVDNKYNSFVSLVERFLTWFKEKKMSYIPCECTEQIVRKKISRQCQQSNHNKDRKCCIKSDRDSDSDREGHIDSHEDRNSYRDKDSNSNKDSKGANENETSNDKDNEKDSD